MLKNKVINDETALLLSKIMRKNLHNIIIIFYKIYEQGFEEFLIRECLHPEYAYYSIEFENFNPQDGSYQKMVKTVGEKKQYQNNAKRYIRKSMDSLIKYWGKNNRKVIIINNIDISKQLSDVFVKLEHKNYKQAKAKLEILFKKMAKIFSEEFFQKQK